MKNIVGIGAFGTFGNPYGFQEVFFHKKPNLKQTFDLNPNAIELTTNSQIFVVKKEFNNEICSISFCVYSYVRERMSSRKGSFIGSCIVFDDCITKGEYIYDCLLDLHTGIISNPKNIEDGVLTVEQARDLEVTDPKGYDEIAETTWPLAVNIRVVKQESVLIAAENLSMSELKNTVSVFFNKAVEVYSQIGTVYFTIDPFVIDSVRSRGLIRIIPLTEFINRSAESSDRLKLSSVQVHVTKPKLHRSNLTRNREVQVEKHYEPQIKPHIRRIWSRPASQWNPTEINRRIKVHNKLVSEYGSLENLYYNLLDEHNRIINNTNIAGDDLAADIIYLRDRINDFLRAYKKEAIVACFAVLFIWIGIAIYLLGDTEIEKRSVAFPGPTMMNQSREPAFTPYNNVLSTDSNGKLSEQSLIELNKSLRTGMLLSEVVSVAIELNRSDIQPTYSEQKSKYAEILLKSNPECFSKDSGDPKLKCKELKNVPAYNYINRPRE